MSRFYGAGSCRQWLSGVYSSQELNIQLLSATPLLKRKTRRIEMKSVGCHCQMTF